MSKAVLISIRPEWVRKILNGSKEDYMRICFAMIDVADLVVFLPDAKDSAGARLEKAYCEYVGKEMEFWSD